MDYAREARVRFREVQHMPGWLRLVMWGSAVAMAAGVYFAGLDPKTPDAAKVVLCVALAGVVVTCVALDRMEIVLDDQNLSFGFWVFRAVVPVDRIVSCEPEKITFWRGGIGIHWTGRAVSYSARYGDGVRIRAKGRKKDWVFSCNDAPRLIALLKEEMAKHGEGTASG